MSPSTSKPQPRPGRAFSGAPAVALAAASLLVSAAAAAEPAKSVSVEGSVALVSDYRYRGVSLSERDPAVQGGITVSHDSGFYAGTWGSSIGGDDLYGSAELDLFGGWSGDVGSGMTLDAAIGYFAYPDGDDALGGADYFESSAKLGRRFGPVEAEAGASYAWSQAALGGSDNLYLFADASAEVPGTAITLEAHAGYSDGAFAYGDDYADWSLGAATSLGPLSLGVAYVDTDLASVPEADAGILFSLTAEF